MNPEHEKLVRDLVAAGDKATQGPWVNMPNDTPWEGKVVAIVGETVESESLAVIHADDDGDDRPEDREFCAQAANARDAIKALLAERDAMRAVVEAAKEEEDARSLLAALALAVGDESVAWQSAQKDYRQKQAATRAALRGLKPKEAENGKA